MQRVSRTLLCLGAIALAPMAMAKGWELNIAPYFWAINMNGDTGAGAIRVHVDEDFNDLIKHFHSGGMLWLEANNDRFGLFVNAMYTELTDNVNVLGFNIYSKNQLGLYTVGASYVAYRARYNNCSQFEFVPYIGARITSNRTSINVDGTSLAASSSHTWTDPIIGARLNYDYNKNWQVIAAADIGGTNFNNHKSFNINGLIGYTLSSAPCVSFYLGYRWLDQHYSTGNGASYFLWNMKLFGPILGVNFRI